MPFDALGLTVLTQANGFSLWHYRTADSRAAVLAPGYFAPVADRLHAGDVLIVQAADATALVPIRADGTAAAGLTLDSAAAGLALIRSATQVIDLSQAADAVVRAIVLAPLPGIVVAGQEVVATATVAGPIAAVVFGLLDQTGAAAAPAQTVPVAGGIAAASFPAPAPGDGYRVRAADAADPTMVALSPPFSAVLPGRLLLEQGGLLLTEQGVALLL
ncbi:hypothetical protein [Caldovatus aquaticus]|uniref:Uncharacterized protein n=1 Tax=Caldovatus aquaticus TaxID=2865671 RepID=A0ABS7EX74_9PROT|nr:hypothetical protein [Caldovatus aquaticus]MBW8267899.1 hypothetical protein [Caldovatus aquaticus]